MVISGNIRILHYNKHYKMTNKKCSSCKELKSTTQFSKFNRGKDGLQAHCKECQHVRTKPLVLELNKANKDGVIYTITNPLGEVYIGCTKKKAEYRFHQHKATYIFQKTNGYSTIPKLHKSFTLWGVDAHIFEVIKDCGKISKSDLRDIENKMIIALKKNGKSLNINN